MAPGTNIGLFDILCVKPRLQQFQVIYSSQIDLEFTGILSGFHLFRIASLKNRSDFLSHLKTTFPDSRAYPGQNITRFAAVTLPQ